MNGLPFDRWVRCFAGDGRITRRAFGGSLTGALGALALVKDLDARKKKKGKKTKKKGHGATCPFLYFACQDDGQECRLQGACCDSDPSRNCAALHAGEEGNRVCCSHAGIGCYGLDNDEFNCSACGHACDTGKHCLNGTCLT